MTEEPGYEFQVRSTLSKLIFLLCSHHSIQQNRLSERAMRDGERIKAMLQYVQEHYMEEVSTTQIAVSASVSVSEALRCFHNMIGTTPICYLKQIRIQKAAELLLSTDWKVAEIGAQCGFQEMSYFAKSFRDIHGCTPSRYREKKKEEAVNERTS